MKKGIFLIILISSFNANAQQKLKDLLYSGKMKTEVGTSVKKDDDLSTKIDTSTRKSVDSVKKMTTANPDSLMKDSTMLVDSSTIRNVDIKDSKADLRDNNKLWKDFIDTVTSTLNTEVMPSKKIKKGNYFVLVDYEIGLDGQVTIKNIFSTPENSYLEQEIKERLSIDTPRLNPVLSGSGNPRKVIKRYTLNLAK